MVILSIAINDKRNSCPEYKGKTRMGHGLGCLKYACISSHIKKELAPIFPLFGMTIGGSIFNIQRNTVYACLAFTFTPQRVDVVKSYFFKVNTDINRQFSTSSCDSAIGAPISNSSQNACYIHLSLAPKTGIGLTKTCIFL